LGHHNVSNLCPHGPEPMPVPDYTLFGMATKLNGLTQADILCSSDTTTSYVI